MKKFFKQLSIVLVLAMVIGMIPAGTASAATAYQLTKTEKQLFVCPNPDDDVKVGAVGTSEDGTKVSTIDYQYKVKVKGGLKKGDKLKLETDNKNIAKVTKAGRIIAVSIGDTVVTAYAVDKAGKKTEIGTIAVQVKANAVSVKIEGVPEEGFGIGEYTLTAVQTNARGGAANDAVQFSIPDEYKEIAEITAAGVLTTKKPGAFKINVKTYQNSKLTGATATASVETKCAVNMLAATQKSNLEFDLTFDSKVKDVVAAEDFTVYYKLNGADVKMAINKVTVDGNDATKAVLTLWNGLTAGTDYYLQYKDAAPVIIKAASLNPEDAAKVVVETTTAVVNELTDIKFSVQNANGIKIPGVENNVTFSTEDTNVCSISGNQIVFFDKNMTATIKVVYSAWYVNANNEYVEKTFTDYVKITSKLADAVTVASYKYTVTNDGDPSVFNASNYAQVNYVASNDSRKQLTIYVKLSDGKTEITNKTAGLTYASADNNIIVMDQNVINPIKEGTTQILVYKDGATTPLIVIPITVRAKRVPVTLTAKISKTTLNTDVRAAASPATAGGFTDKVTVNVSVRDNYGQPFEGASIKYEQVSGTPKLGNASGVATTAADGTASFDISAANLAGDEGSVAFKVTASGNDANTNPVALSFSCKKDQTAPDKATVQKLVLGTGSVDTLIKADKNSTDYGISIQTAPFNGSFQIGNPTNAKLDIAANYAADATDYYYALYKGAANLTSDYNGNFIDATSGSAINAVIADTAKAGYVKKLAAGDYTIRLYKVVTVNGKVTSKSLVDSATFTVKDTQPSLKWTKVNNSIGSNDVTAVTSAFTVEYDGATVVPSTFDIVSGTSSVYVKSVSYDVTTKDGKKFTVTTTVGTTLVVD